MNLLPKRDHNCSSDGEDYYVFNGDFAPTKASLWLPVKTVITMAVGEMKRKTKTIFCPPFWNIFFQFNLDSSQNVFVYRCTCGNQNVTYLAEVCEFRCCYEILKMRGKFAFIGLKVECIFNHSNFSPLTNRTVLGQVGTLLHN